jgi:hypothetical protein
MVMNKQSKTPDNTPTTIRFGSILLKRLHDEEVRSGVRIAEQVRRAVAAWLDKKER